MISLDLDEKTIEGYGIESDSVLARLLDRVDWYVHAADIYTVEVGCTALSLGIALRIAWAISHGGLYSINPAFAGLSAVIPESLLMLVSFIVGTPEIVALCRRDPQETRRFALMGYVCYYIWLAHRIYVPAQSSGIGTMLCLMFATGAAWAYWRLGARQSSNPNP